MNHLKRVKRDHCLCHHIAFVSLDHTLCPSGHWLHSAPQHLDSHCHCHLSQPLNPHLSKHVFFVAFISIAQNMVINVFCGEVLYHILVQRSKTLTLFLIEFWNSRIQQKRCHLQASFYITDKVIWGPHICQNVALNWVTVNQQQNTLLGVKALQILASLY